MPPAATTKKSTPVNCLSLQYRYANALNRYILLKGKEDDKPPHELSLYGERKTEYFPEFSRVHIHEELGISSSLNSWELKWDATQLLMRIKHGRGVLSFFFFSFYLFYYLLFFSSFFNLRRECLGGWFWNDTIFYSVGETESLM